MSNDNDNHHPPIPLHAPITTAPSPTSVSPAQPVPAPAWLQGKWHVTHSTLPMWRTKRNVTITYTPVADSTKIDDLVEYQALDGSSTTAKIKSVHGVDTPAADCAGWAWDWRGKGWLVIASSRWEVLGYGDELDGGGNGGGGAQTQPPDARQWVVTYFAKTLFTPAGIDLYSRHPDGLRPGTVRAIEEALAGVEDEGVRSLAKELFEVKMDGARKD
ncbi:histidinolphosphatase-like protein [Diplodia corticola]|uniref:Histidinolphosphatase-like protein n=1 Tax=Diplodia corticola TaxID=236234 RepID=A0A1J9QV39_9PEZI|nr:histidinolphosphatase-like protein [Diplodia corticola]OJD32296.1 histidinolphosphatase-like protein [Diplodia corticola]